MSKYIMKGIGITLIVVPIIGLLSWFANDLGWKKVFKAVVVGILVNAGILGYLLLIGWLMK